MHQSASLSAVYRYLFTKFDKTQVVDELGKLKFFMFR